MSKRVDLNRHWLVMVDDNFKMADKNVVSEYNYRIVTNRIVSFRDRIVERVACSRNQGEYYVA